MSEEKKKQGGKSPSVPVSTLAKLCHITPMRIQQLAQEGVMVRTGRGRYDLFSSISKYIKYLQERKVNQWDSEEDNPTELKRQQLRRTKEEADKLELLNAKTRGELVSVEKVKRAGEKIMSAIKTKILNMPMKDEDKDSCLRDLLRLEDLEYDEPD